MYVHKGFQAPKGINPEDGTCNICQTVLKPSILVETSSQIPKINHSKSRLAKLILIRMILL
jgi:hypothetical protein